MCCQQLFRVAGCCAEQSTVVPCRLLRAVACCVGGIKGGVGGSLALSRRRVSSLEDLRVRQAARRRDEIGPPRRAGPRRRRQLCVTHGGSSASLHSQARYLQYRTLPGTEQRAITTIKFIRYREFDIRMRLSE